MSSTALGHVDAFEQGMAALVRYVAHPDGDAHKLVNPYNPASHLQEYEEWEAGYEYAWYLFKQPEAA
jgi:hypothetical protein